MKSRSCINFTFDPDLPLHHLNKLRRNGEPQASISPDGKWQASTGHAHNVVLRTGDDFHIDRVLIGHNDVDWSSAFNTDGTILATGSGLEKRGEIIFWDTSSWKAKERTYLSEQVTTGLSFHPHLPLLAACSFDGRAWLLHSKTGAVLKQLFPAGSKTMEVVFSPDGKYLVAARTSNGLSVWSVNDSESDPVALETEFNDPDEQFWTVQFTNDGRTLAVGTESGLIQLFRFPDCQSLVKFRTSSLTIRKSNRRTEMVIALVSSFDI